MRNRRAGVSRREFLQTVGAAAGAAGAAAMAGCVSVGSAPPAGSEGGIGLLIDPADPIAASPQAQWALGHFREALSRRGISTHVADAVEPGLQVVIAGSQSPRARDVLATFKANASTAPESLILLPGRSRLVYLIAGADGSGLAYALTELAQRVAHAGANPWDALMISQPIIEQPANPVRGICRVFVSEEEDKPWFYNQDGWRQYFDMLAMHRFNRFNLSLGLAYDFSTNVADAYFFFAYPFFLKVPGYNVRVMARGGTPLSDQEQAKNLATLQFISREAATRGLHFQLGLWTHSIAWGGNPNYTLDGISPATQATYSRDALHALLEACPDIRGVTIRTHGESGIPESATIDLWKTIFDGTRNLSGNRRVQIDLHAKGITFEIIDAARATGNPVIVTPKYWAEHNGLPYIQSSIREWELPKADTGGLMSRSTGSRNHMRYGYGDILRKNRAYGVVHRVFPGTQRFLLGGDPLFAREYGRVFRFNGTDGVEFFEPLAFKGRQGTGLARNRGCYLDAALAPRWPDQMDKYQYTFCLWGRLSYNPDAEPEVYRRLLRREFGDAAPAVEKSLGAASRILPLVTVAHSPSAAQANFWPEIYSNMSHHDATNPTYGDDTPTPRVFGTVSSLDPQLFASVNESAEALLAAKGLGKMTVCEVADQLDAWTAAATAEPLLQTSSARGSAAQRRAALEVSLLSAMGRFWAAKFRTGLLYAIFDRSGHEPARQAALAEYQKARDAMALAAGTARGVYIPDITFGADRKIRGTWADRLSHIDRDLESMKTATPHPTFSDAQGAAALARARKPAARPRITPQHVPAPAFRPGSPLSIELRAPWRADGELAVRLLYRHVNQAERYQSLTMTRGTRDFDAFSAAIPADYTQSPYALQYYFELHCGTVDGQADATALFPAFRENFLGMPYFLVPQE